MLKKLLTAGMLFLAASAAFADQALESKIVINVPATVSDNVPRPFQWQVPPGFNHGYPIFIKKVTVNPGAEGPYPAGFAVNLTRKSDGSILLNDTCTQASMPANGFSESFFTDYFKMAVGDTLDLTYRSWSTNGLPGDKVAWTVHIWYSTCE